MPFPGRKFYFKRTNSRGEEQRSVAARQESAGRPVSVGGSGLGRVCGRRNRSEHRGGAKPQKIRPAKRTLKWPPCTAAGHDTRGITRSLRAPGLYTYSYDNNVSVL